MSEWFDSIELHTYLIRDYPEVVELGNHLFQEIMDINKDNIKTSKERYRSKEILKLILINLFISYQSELPIRYSRRKSSYSKDGRYGQIFFQYERVIRTIDKLIKLNYIEHKIGRHIKDKDMGLESRMKATSKLIELFHTYNFHGLQLKRQRPENLVQLRDKQGKDLPFEDNRKLELMVRNLERYNDFIENQVIDVRLKEDVKVNLEFLQIQKYGVSNGSIQIIDFQTKEHDKEFLFDDNREIIQGYQFDGKNYFIFDSKISGRVKKDLISNKVNISSKNQYYIKYINNKVYKHYNKQVNKTTSMTGTISDNSKQNPSVTITTRPRYKYYKSKLEKRPLFEHGITQLDFRLKYEYLHRVFNKYPDLGGRVYGAVHINLPKEIRKYIIINESPTIELDFGAHHIRIIYNRLGIHYDKKDPYEELCKDNPELRPVYKIVLLVSINAENEKDGLKGMSDELRKEGFPNEYLTKDFLKQRIEEFKKVHPDIAKFINTGEGLVCQYYEGRIVDIILNRMLREKIPCLPVHDSFIVPAKHEDFLYEVMIEAYKKVIGEDYSPIIKKVE